LREWTPANLGRHSNAIADLSGSEKRDTVHVAAEEEGITVKTIAMVVAGGRAQSGQVEPALGTRSSGALTNFLFKLVNQRLQVVMECRVQRSVNVTVDRKTRGLLGPLHQNASKHGVHVVGVRRHHDVHELHERSSGSDFTQRRLGSRSRSRSRSRCRSRSRSGSRSRSRSGSRRADA
jgi:hypothetical protein